MRLTCLECGHQVDISPGEAKRKQLSNCVCGREHVFPDLLDTGTRPNNWAADRARTRAFRAAGVVKNRGATALWASVVGLVCFPLSLVGVGIGIYVLAGLSPQVRFYSGYRKAIAAIFIGILGFVAESMLLHHWFSLKNQEMTSLIQGSAPDEMGAVLRAQRIFHKENGRFGTLDEIPYKPLYGEYCIYLSPNDVLPATKGQESVYCPLPTNYLPYVSSDRFLGVGLANLDDDPQLDIWLVSETGQIVHEVDDTEIDIAD